jgi:lipid II:glycine glycyltransferase (peptidoglycan interpeptide bridge formation enzyme)
VEILKGFTSPDWNDLVAGLPGAHLLQTCQWARVKARVGWQPQPLVWRDGGAVQAAALVLRRPIPIAGFAAHTCLLYAPRGPLLDWGDNSLRRQVLDDLQVFARQQGAIFIKIDPEVVLGTGVPGTPDAVEDPAGAGIQAGLAERGWHYSSDQIQFRNTFLIDLDLSEADLLASMKPKSRYNVRLAERKGVIVRPGGLDDLEILYRMYAETSVRDGFVIRERAYYLAVWQEFMQAALAEPLIAEVEGVPVAGIVVFRFAGRAYFLYGMSRYLHRERMPNHLLQWEAMRRARVAGCRVYDLWGAPETFDASDSMWGVFRFKEGLGGRVVRTLGAWDFPTNPWLYRLYTRTLPRLLDVMRRRGRARTQREVNRQEII